MGTTFPSQVIVFVCCVFESHHFRYLIYLRIENYLVSKLSDSQKTEKSEVDFAFRNMFEDPGESGILIAKRTRVSRSSKRLASRVIICGILLLELVVKQ